MRTNPYLAVGRAIDIMRRQAEAAWAYEVRSWMRKDAQPRFQERAAETSAEARSAYREVFGCAPEGES